MAFAVLPPNLSGTGIESDAGLTGCCDTYLQWSPDDQSVLVMPEGMSDGTADPTPPARPGHPTRKPAPWTAPAPGLAAKRP